MPAGTRDGAPRSPVSSGSLALLVAILFGSGCLAGSPADLSDEERRARIEELWSELEPKAPDVPGVTAEELLDSDRRSSVVLVDVRSPEEQAVSMLPGAITSDELEANPDRYRDREIVAYCTIGFRSAKYADRLRREGWNAANMPGSILVWTHEGGTLVDREGRPTRRIHVYGADWNLAATDFEAVW